MKALPIELTPVVLASLAGILLSLSFTYIPGWRVTYGKMSEETKSLITLGVLLLSTVIIYVLVMLGALLPNEEVNGWSFFWMFVLSVTSNQSIYKLSPQPTDVKTAKAQRTPIKNGNLDAG